MPSVLRGRPKAPPKVSFQRIPYVLEIPNLIELQKSSYEQFLDDGMREAFGDISPIEDFTGNLVLQFLEHSLGDETYSVEECQDRDMTYARPLKVKVRLITKQDGEIKEAKEQEIFMGDFPYMTPKGTFIINGAERVIVSQLVRSPGIYFQDVVDPTGKRLFIATVIPNRGAWLEFETDANDTIGVRIDRTRKIMATVLIRALGYQTDEEILAQFENDPVIMKTIEKDSIKTSDDALIEIYRRLRPGDPPSVESARTLLHNLFFEPKRYNLAKVGRYKMNKKLGLKIACHSCGTLHRPGVIGCGECTASRIYQQILHISMPFGICVLACAAPVFYGQIYNSSVGLLPATITSRVAPISYKQILEPRDMIAIVRYMAHQISGKNVMHPLNESQFEVPVQVDDIDHLGNRRVRAVGELLQNQFRLALLRLERVVRERMTVQDLETVTPQALINIRPVVAAIKEFFGSSQLSQFMDQTNSLAELAHKRRLSALGPGGLSRERAGFEVRDVHYSHYGRICPIETPEGPNIGLIGSLATYAKVNEFGFIMTPYRKVGALSQDVKEKGGNLLHRKGEFIDARRRQELTEKGIQFTVDPVISNEVWYLCGDEEDDHIIAQANTPIDESSRIAVDRVVVRAKHETQLVRKDKVDLLDVSPKQIVSVATALIPFLEHDDANRALMGANMQRQAVPLIQPDAALVATGMEYRAAKDSGALLIAEHSGRVASVDSHMISVECDEPEEIKNLRAKKSQRIRLNEEEARHLGEWDRAHPKGLHQYRLLKFRRSNAATCINQRPIVAKGRRVEVGDVIADGASSVEGELALGRNVLVAFMPWEGYNYEDAILISEELVSDDIFTSIHIEEYECEARDTKLGAEEITRDVPNVGEEALRDLDEKGRIRIGADVRPEDILVGKVTPKGETELTAEERLLRAIFGEKARDVRDTSLKVPHGERGKVIDVKVFSREAGDELRPGVNQLVRVYVAQKRKILQGDKMAGRHGNKGVIAKVLPREDMPYLPDGTPVQLILNPLGVPSRMNIGQILETHVGRAAAVLGERVESPVFDGAREPEIREMMKKSHLKEVLDAKGLRLTREDIYYLLRKDTMEERLRELLRKKSINLSREQTLKIVNSSRPVEELKKTFKKNKAAITDAEINRVVEGTTLADRVGEIARMRKINLQEDDQRNLTDYIEKFLEVPEDGKTVLFDGRTGEPFDCRVTVGQIYMMKLAHLVDDKIHARSTGPYSLITQQPLGGKAQFGGQRFGEMEVWALEAYGAAYTLQEMLTVKSDDVVGRVKTYEAIVKGENVLEPGIPESFKVLIKELQSLCLDVRTLSKDNLGKLRPIELKGAEEQDIKATARELGLDIGEEALTL